MPKSYNRDIIVVSAKALVDENTFQHEVEVLKDILYTVEDVFYVANSMEVIDLNTYRISRKKFNVVRSLCDSQLPPFKFVLSRN